VQRVLRFDTSLSVDKYQRKDSARSVQVTFQSHKLMREAQSVHQGSNLSSDKSQEE
jgi:hypothetical protein